MAGLEACASQVISVVERFGEAEEVDEPGYAKDDGRYEVAPSPPDVEGDVPADDGGEVGAVGNAGYVSEWEDVDVRGRTKRHRFP